MTYATYLHLRRRLHFVCLLAVISMHTVRAQTSTSSENVIILTGTKVSSAPPVVPTYPSLASTILSGALTGTVGNVGNVGNATTSTETETETDTDIDTDTATVLVSGTSSGLSRPANVSTSVAAVATNTRPCNNYAEFCSRKYSNVTEVGCHNSPFVRVGSAAANQEYPVTDQLNDGVRFLQAQVQWPVNGSAPHVCHTSCDLLDAGPLADWLATVREWVVAHPYDVVTILLGNGNYSSPDAYVPHIDASGLRPYVFTPPAVPLTRDAWPTLEHMILQGQRVVLFLDYQANQTTYPWLMDEFAHMWETPFDPVDGAFPCTVQRPPDLAPADARARLYLMNHNFNVEVTLLGNALLVPAVSALNLTNAAAGNGSVGLAADNCRAAWDVPPKVLNVDYYNHGSYPGSVFEAAARANGVTYTRPCCGPGVSGAATVGALVAAVAVRATVGAALASVLVWIA